MKIRLAGIVKESIVDGPGIRYALYTQGCYHNCYKCHNPQTHDINGGYLKEIDEIVYDINSNKNLSGITISGGEPFLQIAECFELVNKISIELDVIIYTGFTYEILSKASRTNQKLEAILNRINYLIDGKFVHNLKDLDLNFIGVQIKELSILKKLTLPRLIIITM